MNEGVDGGMAQIVRDAMLNTYPKGESIPKAPVTKGRNCAGGLYDTDFNFHFFVCLDNAVRK